MVFLIICDNTIKHINGQTDATKSMNSLPYDHFKQDSFYCEVGGWSGHDELNHHFLDSPSNHVSEDQYSLSRKKVYTFVEPSTKKQGVQMKSRGCATPTIELVKLDQTSF